MTLRPTTSPIPANTPKRGQKGKKPSIVLARSATRSRKWLEGSRGCSLGDLNQPPEVVGSVDNSSGRASWRCSSWNWANAVKPLPRHDHFAKWKIIFQLSTKFYKISQKWPLQKMIKKWSKNDQKTTPQKVEKTPFSLLHTPAIPAELTYRKRGGVKSSTSCWRNHINP